MEEVKLLEKAASELNFLWWHMRGDFGLLMGFASWTFVLRMLFKPVTKFLERYIEQAEDTESAWARKLIGSPAWRFMNFTLDYLASVKLPTITARKQEQDKTHRPPAGPENGD